MKFCVSVGCHRGLPYVVCPFRLQDVAGVFELQMSDRCSKERAYFAVCGSLREYLSQVVRVAFKQCCLSLGLADLT